MNPHFLRITLGVLSSVIGLAQKVPDTDIACVQSLELPTRGLLAARAGSSGTIEAVIEVGDTGKPAKWELLGENRMLSAEVDVAMSLSRFVPQCRGRTIRLVFSFKLEDPPTDSIVPPAVRFLPPNRFELVFRRVKPNLDPGSPPGNTKRGKKQHSR